MSDHARPWPPGDSLTDERLAFLAAEPELRKLSRPWWLVVIRLFTSVDGANSRMWSPGASSTLESGTSSGMTQEMRDDRMLDFVVAADVAAQKLNADERKALRATGELPPWFLGAVQAARKDLKRR